MRSTVRGMANKKSKGLVSYNGLPTVIEDFFKLLPETEAKKPGKRARKRKRV